MCVMALVRGELISLLFLSAAMHRTSAGVSPGSAGSAQQVSSSFGYTQVLDKSASALAGAITSSKVGVPHTQARSCPRADCWCSQSR